MISEGCTTNGTSFWCPPRQLVRQRTCRRCQLRLLRRQRAAAILRSTSTIYPTWAAATTAHPRITEQLSEDAMARQRLLPGHALRSMGFLRGLFGNSPVAENAAIGPRGNCQRSHRPIRLQFRRQTRCQGIGCEPRFGALLATVKKHDAGHADSLTAEDIAARVDAWKQSGGCCSRSDQGHPGRQALAGALVTWEPEPYLGPAYHPLSGTTNDHGYAYIAPALEGFQGFSSDSTRSEFPGKCRARRQFRPATTRRAPWGGRSLWTCTAASTSSILT